MFGSAFYIININLDEENEIMPKLSNFWIFNAFENQYELSLGEFEVDAYRDSEMHQFLIYVLFILSTFIIQITFLNMLIAIMGDTYDRATEERDNNARATKLRIMGDYVNLILKDEDVPEEKPEAPAATGSTVFDSTSPRALQQEKEEDTADKVREDLLFVVQPADDDSNENMSWEGHIATLKRATERTIGKTESVLSKSLDKVLERVIEAESRDATQEREMKQNLDKVMKGVKDEIKDQAEQIKNVVNKQDKQAEK